MTLIVGGVPFYAALGYGVWLHSDTYRSTKQRELMRFLELPASIGAVEPRSYYQADFTDIRVWLPGRRSEIFHCDRAEMHELPRQGEAFWLAIRDGRLTIDASQWRLADYDAVLRSGLAHDFAALQLRWVDLFDVDLTWRGGGTALTVRSATGRIQFNGGNEGRLSVVSHTLNDTRTEEPINVVARFRPSRDLVVHEVVLRVPSLPVEALGLASVLGASQARGRFEGRLSYREDDGEPRVEMAGRAEGIHLEDWTGRMEGGPVHGQVDMKLDDASLTADALVHAKFSGRAVGVRLEEITRLLGVTPVAGRTEVEVLNAEFAERRLVRMNVRGRVVDGSLAPIAAMIGPGQVAGTFRLDVNALELAGEDVVAADVDVEIVPPKDKPATIDNELLMHAARKLLGVEISPVIATTLKRLETVTYSRFAFKLLVDDGQLRILGSHGQGNRAILTVKVFGTELAVVTQPDTAIELEPLLTRLRAVGAERIRDLIERHQPTTTTAPAQG